MKIFSIVHQFPPDRFGGAERHALQLARVSASRHQVMLYTQAVFSDGPGAREDTVDGLRVRRWTDRSPAAQPDLAKDLLKSCEEFAPDVVHVHHGIGFPPRAIFRITREYPSVLTLHDYWWICARTRLMFRGETPCNGPSVEKCAECFAGKDASLLAGETAAFLEMGFVSRLVRALRKTLPDSGAASGGKAKEKLSDLLIASAATRIMFFLRRRAFHQRLLHGFNAIISPSKYLLGRYRETVSRIDAGRSTVIPYGIDLDEVRVKRRGQIKAPVRFGLIGHLTREKGLQVCVEAFRGIPAKTATLDVHGDANLADTGIESIRYHGPFTPDRLGMILSSIDVLIVPSTWPENAPKVIHEAYGAGIPVIASNLGALPEFVGENRGGRLFDAGDEKALANAVRDFADHPELVERERRHIPAPASIEETAEEIEGIYRRIGA